MVKFVSILLCVFVLPLLVADEWQEPELTNPPSPRFGHTMVNLNGSAHVYGGQTSGSLMRGTLLSDLWRLEDAQASWGELQIDNPPPARCEHAAAVLNGSMYVYGGLDSSGAHLADVWQYDPATTAWLQKHATAPPGARAQHTLAVAQGKIWVMGGENGSELSDVWSYDPGMNRWEQKNSMPYSRSGHTAVTYYEKIYVFGGSSDVLIYDPSLDSWEVISPSPFGTFPQARAQHIAVRDGDVMRVFGGETQQGEELGDCWEYNFADNLWTAQDPMPATLTNSASVVIATSQILAESSSNTITFGGLSGGVAVDTTFYYGDGGTTPPVTEKKLHNQIGMLDAGEYSLLLLYFEDVQRGVKLTLEWQEDVELGLFTYPKSSASWHAMNNLASAYRYLQKQDPRLHLADMQPLPAKINATKTGYSIETTFLRARLVIIGVRNLDDMQSASAIQLGLDNFEVNPTGIAYFFPVGTENSTSSFQTHFLHVPVAPKDSFSWYPRSARGEETTMTGDEYWEWMYKDATQNEDFCITYAIAGFLFP